MCQGRSSCMDESSGYKNVKRHQWKFPFQLRVGATGLGVGFGCGVGIGFGSPLNLRGIPGLGQIVSSISNSLGSLNTAAGGLGTKVRMQVRGQGIKGLDIGAGCGIGLGYGFGIGLMLRPDVLEGMSRAVQHHIGKMMKSLPPQLQHMALPGQQNILPGQLYSMPGQQHMALPGQLHSLPGQQNAAVPGQQHSMPGQQSPATSSLPQTLPRHSTPSSALSHGSTRHPTQSENVWPGNISGAEGISQRSGDESSSVDGALLKELSRSLLEQQSQIRELQKENLELRKAVCKLDKKAPFCRMG